MGKNNLIGESLYQIVLFQLEFINAMKNKDYYHVILSAGEPQDIEAKNEEEAVDKATFKGFIEAETNNNPSIPMDRAVVIGKEGLHCYSITSKPRRISSQEFKKGLSPRSQARYCKLIFQELGKLKSKKYWLPAIEILIK